MIRMFYLLTPVYVTLFWAIVLMFTFKKENRPKNFLGRFMLVAFLLYLSHAIFFLENYSLYVWFDSIYLFTSLASFPMYYIYVRLLTTDDKPHFVQHGLLILPSIAIGILALIGYLQMSSDEQYYYVSEILKGNLSTDTSSLFRYQTGVLISKKILFVVQSIIYSILCYKRIQSHNKEILNYYSNTDGNQLRWLHFFNISLIVTSIFSVSAELMGRETFATEPAFLPIPSFIFSLLLFSIGFLGNKQVAIHLDDEPSIYEKHPTNLEKLKQRLIVSFNNDHVFLDTQLKITDLVMKLNTNRTYISKLINDDFGMNFNDYVNLYRVNHAKSLLNNPEFHKYHLEAIAQMSGFGSQASFIRAFQKVEQIPPGKYRQLYANT